MYMNIPYHIKQNVDWLYFRKAGIALSISCGLSIVLGLWSYSFAEGERNLYRMSQARLDKIKAQYQGALNQRQLIEQYFEPFKKLVRRGFIGSENRLNLIETLTGVAEKRKIAPIAYHMKALKPYAGNGKINSNLFQINASEVVLHMKLLHEHDLLDVFAELDQRTSGIYDIKKCDLSLAGEKIVFAAHAANIDAECILTWFTIQPVIKI